MFGSSSSQNDHDREAIDLYQNPSDGKVFNTEEDESNFRVDLEKIKKGYKMLDDMERRLLGYAQKVGVSSPPVVTNQACHSSPGDKQKLHSSFNACIASKEVRSSMGLGEDIYTRHFADRGQNGANRPGACLTSPKNDPLDEVMMHEKEDNICREPDYSFKKSSKECLAFPRNEEPRQAGLFGGLKQAQSLVTQSLNQPLGSLAFKKKLNQSNNPIFFYPDNVIIEEESGQIKISNIDRSARDELSTVSKERTGSFASTNELKDASSVQADLFKELSMQLHQIEQREQQFKKAYRPNIPKVENVPSVNDVSHDRVTIKSRDAQNIEERKSPNRVSLEQPPNKLLIRKVFQEQATEEKQNTKANSFRTPSALPTKIANKSLLTTAISNKTNITAPSQQSPSEDHPLYSYDTRPNQSNNGHLEEIVEAQRLLIEKMQRELVEERERNRMDGERGDDDGCAAGRIVQPDKFDDIMAAFLSKKQQWDRLKQHNRLSSFTPTPAITPQPLPQAQIPPQPQVVHQAPPTIVYQIPPLIQIQQQPLLQHFAQNSKENLPKFDFPNKNAEKLKKSTFRRKESSRSSENSQSESGDHDEESTFMRSKANSRNWQHGRKDEMRIEEKEEATLPYGRDQQRQMTSLKGKKRKQGHSREKSIEMSLSSSRQTGRKTKRAVFVERKDTDSRITSRGKSRLQSANKSGIAREKSCFSNNGRSTNSRDNSYNKENRAPRHNIRMNRQKYVETESSQINPMKEQQKKRSKLSRINSYSKESEQNSSLRDKSSNNSNYISMHSRKYSRNLDKSNNTNSNVAKVTPKSKVARKEKTDGREDFNAFPENFMFKLADMVAGMIEEKKIKPRPPKAQKSSMHKPPQNSKFY